MTALSADRQTLAHNGGSLRTFPVAANVTIYAGALVVINQATGYAQPGSTSTTITAVGRAEAQANNAGGAAAAISVQVRRGIFNFQNSTSADLITTENIGQAVYVVDDQTVALTSGSSTRSPAGRVYLVDADGVWVEIL